MKYSSVKDGSIISAIVGNKREILLIVADYSDFFTSPIHKAYIYGTDVYYIININRLDFYLTDIRKLTEFERTLYL